MIHAADDFSAGRGEFEDRYATAGLANADHFLESAIGIGDVSQTECDADDLKLIAIERQVLGVGFDKRKLPLLAGAGWPLEKPTLEHWPNP